MLRPPAALVRIRIQFEQRLYPVKSGDARKQQCGLERRASLALIIRVWRFQSVHVCTECNKETHLFRRACIVMKCAAATRLPGIYIRASAQQQFAVIRLRPEQHGRSVVPACIRVCPCLQQGIQHGKIGRPVEPASKLLCDQLSSKGAHFFRAVDIPLIEQALFQFGPRGATALVRTVTNRCIGQ